ncbi:hypothetical protein BDM02DRAFT_3189965 [Thelephora ganbajun]|uniref:Uncharacterized protein n=1 Tax=Thelephora ganbajun TaxID=370292 RepID=A0ACB6Z703_THEGA|nr:hypothetical protein BDM02DRAFT_3189965 [Thelephora ganbajun]
MKPNKNSNHPILISRLRGQKYPPPIPKLGNLECFFAKPFEEHPQSKGIQLPESSFPVPGPLDPTKRDGLLSYAYSLYDTFVTGESPTGPDGPIAAHAPMLLPLLELLHGLDPSHLQTALLLGCVYHHQGLYQRALNVNRELLERYPNNVEMMCNMGSTFKVMGLTVQAFEFWWKALHIQPALWDALDNMLTVILGSSHWEGDLPNPSHSQSFHEQQLRQSLELCNFVLDSTDGHVVELHCAQRTLHLRSIICHALHDQREWADLFRGIQLALNSSESSRTPPYAIDDLILAAHFVGALACVDQLSPTTPGLEGTMKVTDELRRKISPDFDVFEFIRTNSERLLGTVGKSPPILLLSPAEALYLPSAMWKPTHILSLPDSVSRFSTSGSLRDDTGIITGRLLSTLATRIGGVARVNDFGPDGSRIGQFGNFSKFQPSLSVVLLLRYVALGLAPSSQAFKALGDLISSIGEDVTRVMTEGGAGSEMKLDTTGVAMLYHEFGMKMHC